MYFEKESLQNNIGDDLDKRNRNFEKIESDTTAMATNLITNGDFSNGVTGWVPYYSTLSITNGIASILGDGTSGAPYTEGVSNMNVIPSSKYYLRFKARVTNSLCSKIRLRVSGSFAITDLDILNPIQNQWYEPSVIASSTTQSGVMKYYFSQTYADASTANGKTLEIDNVTVIDLTTTFGAGKEPTVGQMDKIMSKFTNSWFDGTKNLFRASETLNKLMALDKEKANKVQEAWITPTLVNGATAYDTNTVGYIKDEMGFVHLKGRIVTPAYGTQAFTLPAGYRPKQYLNFPCFDVSLKYNTIEIGKSANSYVYISRETAPLYISLDGITFRAEA